MFPFILGAKKPELPNNFKKPKTSFKIPNMSILAQIYS